MSETSTPRKPTLYQYQVCPFCWKVRTLLALKKVDYDIVEVHPLNKKEIEFSDYKKVPIFIDADGTQVNDSNEIMKYIDEKYEGPSVFESSPEAQANEKKWLDWSESYVKAVPPLIYSNMSDSLKAFDYITKTSQFSWHQKALIKYSGAVVMKMVAKKSAARQGIENPPSHFEGMISEWERSLGENNYAGGEKPNAADSAVYGITMSMSELPAAKLFTKHPKFMSWLGNMEAQTNTKLVIN